MTSKTVIRTSQQGWVVYNAANPDNFYVFRSDEPERFVKFITEKVAGIKIDQLIEKRNAEIEAARVSMGERI